MIGSMFFKARHDKRMQARESPRRINDVIESFFESKVERADREGPAMSFAIWRDELLDRIDESRAIERRIGFSEKRQRRSIVALVKVPQNYRRRRKHVL